MTLITIAGLLSACGGGSNSLEGKYVKSKEDNLCSEYVDFRSDKDIELKRSSWSSGAMEDVTYEKIEDGKYKFTFEDGSTEQYILNFNKDKTKLKMNKVGNDNICTFKKEDNS